MRERIWTRCPNRRCVPLITLEPVVTPRLRPDLGAPTGEGAGSAQPPERLGKSVHATSHSETGTWANLAAQDHRSHQILSMCICLLGGCWSIFLFMYVCAHLFMYTVWKKSDGAELFGTFIAFTECWLKLSAGTESIAELHQKSDFVSFLCGRWNRKKIRLSILKMKEIYLV